MSDLKDFFLQDLMFLHIQLFNLKKENEALILGSQKNKSISKLVETSSKKIKTEVKEYGVEIVESHKEQWRANEKEAKRADEKESGAHLSLQQSATKEPWAVSGGGEDGGVAGKKGESWHFFVASGDSDFNSYKEWKSVDHGAYLTLIKTLDSMSKMLLLLAKEKSKEVGSSMFASSNNEVFEKVYSDAKALAKKLKIENAWASELLRLSASKDSEILLKNLIDDGYWVTKEAGGLFCRQMVDGKFIADKKVKPFFSHLNGLTNELDVKGAPSNEYFDQKYDESFDSGWVQALVDYKIDYENAYYLMRVSQDSDSRQVCGSLLNLIIMNGSEKCMQLLVKDDKVAQLCLQDAALSYESVINNPEIQKLIKDERELTKDKKSEEDSLEKRMSKIEKKLPYFYSKTVIGMMRAIDPVALSYYDLLFGKKSKEHFDLMSSFFDKKQILKNAHISQRQAIACNAIEMYMDFSARKIPLQAVKFLIKNEIFDLTKVSPKVFPNLMEGIAHDLLSKEVSATTDLFVKWLNNEQVVKGLKKSGINLNELLYESLIAPIKKAKVLKMSIAHNFFENFEQQIGKGKKVQTCYNFDGLANLSEEKLNLIGLSKEQYMSIADEIDSYLVSMDSSVFDVNNSGKKQVNSWHSQIVLSTEMQEALSNMRLKVLSLGGGNVSAAKVLRI